MPAGGHDHREVRVVRAQHAGRRAAQIIPLAQARANPTRMDWSGYRPGRPSFLGRRVLRNVDLSQIPKIQQTYAATLRDNARPGDWIQTPDGAWKQK